MVSEGKGQFFRGGEHTSGRASGRLKARERRLEREQGPVDRHKTSDDETSAVSDEAMSVDEVRTWERLR